MSDCSCKMFELPECTACEPRVPATPLSLINRPGLSQIAYRVGTFSAFRQAMLDALVLQPVRSVDPANPALSNQLATRSSDDYGVAVLEMWAYVLDVLTFYQQSIANEAFIRTAELRDSLARLAALLGYEPARGVAATALLAFFADAGTSTKLLPGLRTQSVPPPGKNPATFELSDKLTLDPNANQPVLAGTPQPAVFTSSGELLVDSGGPPVVAGTKLVFFNTDPAVQSAAEQVVRAVSPSVLGGKIVQWSGTLGGAPVSSLQVARFGRKFRYFGANAPSTFPLLDSVLQTWFMVPTDFSVPASAGGQIVNLDGTFDGIATGGSVWIYYAGLDPSTDNSFVQQFRIASVAQGSDSRGPLTGACTVLTLDQPFVHDLKDLRGLAIYEALGDPLNFLQQTNSDNIPATSSTLYVADASGVHKGTEMILISGTDSDVVRATAEPAAPSGGSTPPWAITITPPLVNNYTASQTLLYANVASATHGETQNEQVLGDGNASLEWQEFAVPVSPVTYVPDPAADRGASSTLKVFVNEIEWTEVATFFGHGPDETIFATRVDDQGVTHVRFGDGQTGRRLPTGIRNVTAQMRKGLGTDGNVLGDAISIILQQQPGLKSVINPLPAFGGQDPEPADLIRETAPSTVITLGRAVSLRDYEVFALSYAGVAKARAVWADFQSRRGVALTVAAAGGKPLDQLADPLRNFLDDHRDPNVPLSVSDYLPVHFYFSAALHLRNGYKQSSVKTVAEAQFGPNDDGSGYLSFDQLQFGQTMFQSALISVLQNVAGVDWVELLGFHESPSAAGHGFGSDPNLREAIIIGPQEIAWPTLNDSTVAAVNLEYSGGVSDLEGS